VIATAVKVVFIFAAASGLRVTLLLMITGMLAFALRKRSAGLQHGLWTGALTAALLIPVLGATFSKIRLSNPVGASEVLAAGWRRIVVATATSDPGDQDANGAVTNGPLSGLFNIDSVLGPTPAGSTSLNTVGVIAGAIWLVGIGILLSRLLASNLGVARLHRRARRVSDRRVKAVWDEVVAQSAQAVSLLEADAIRAPATAGLFRPSIFLPPEAASWTTERLRAALTHEYAHVRRRDCLTQLIGDISVALYWVNPLVWYARGRMVIERERACDDVVLGAGVSPTAYAAILVETLRATLSASPGTIGVLAMARPSEMETRLTSILESERDRHPLSIRAVGVPATMITASALLISASHLYGAPDRSTRETSGAISALVVQVGAPRQSREEPDRRNDSTAKPSSERVLLDETTLRLVPGPEVMHGPDSLLAHMLVAGLSRTPSWEGDLVRDRSAWTLSRQRNGRLVEPLIESLSDNDWRIRAYAAWALGAARDPRAVPGLLPLLRDQVWRMRAMAAFALKEIGDVRATDAMVVALHDEAWQVRVNAVDFIGARADLESTSLLRNALSDRHIAVRLAAEAALRNAGSHF
jgi:beta-lactamase regulating signal transducer with metallopeptidase domain